MGKNQRKFCPKCGHAVDVSARVCPHCGFNLAKYFNHNLPELRRQKDQQVARPKRFSASRLSRHWLSWLLGGLIVLFLVVGFFAARDRGRSFTALNKPTAAQTLSKRLPHYSWVVTKKGQEGALNDTLVEFFNGKKSIVTNANPITLKLCDQLLTDSQARDKINDLVKNGHNNYQITGDSLKINGHNSIRHVKKIGDHYEFLMLTSNGDKVKEIMKPYKKINPRLQN